MSTDVKSSPLPCGFIRLILSTRVESESVTKEKCGLKVVFLASLSLLPNYILRLVIMLSRRT